MSISTRVLVVIVGLLFLWNVGQWWRKTTYVPDVTENLPVLPTNIIYHKTGGNSWSFMIWYYEHDGIRCYVTQERRLDAIASSTSCVRKLPGDESHVPSSARP